MRHANLIKKAQIFYALAVSKEKLPANSDNIKTILSNIDKLETFKSRIDYAEKNLIYLFYCK